MCNKQIYKFVKFLNDALCNINKQYQHSNKLIKQIIFAQSTQFIKNKNINSLSQKLH